MTSRRLLTVLLLAGLVGCRRDPVLIGFWDVTAIEVQGVAQPDYGTMEFQADGTLHIIARYDWQGSGFLPLDQPQHLIAQTDAGQEDDYTEVYAEKGEVHTVTMDGGRYGIDDYLGHSCRLVGEDVPLAGLSSSAASLDVIYTLTR